MKKLELQNTDLFTSLNDDEIEDLHRGGLKVIQKKDGYRFSMDAVLLANFITVKRNERVADLGTGCGVIPLIIAFRNPTAIITAVEMDETAGRMAGESVEMNDLSDQITIVVKDIKDLGNAYRSGSFDVVTTNPPYGRLNSGRINPDPKKAAARHEISGTLDDFLQCASYLLKYRGRLALVYPAAMLADLIVRLREMNLEPKRMQTVYTGKNRKAKLVLMEAVKGGGRELELLQPLYIYDNHGNYSKEFEAMYR